MTTTPITIIGGGLAGSEAAWQIAQRGSEVLLYEMRPKITTGAHTSENLAELVCSNSLGSNLINRASGILKEELRILNSLLIDCADRTAVPAGGALAVDRQLFSQLVTRKIESHPKIKIIRQEVKAVPEIPTIIATGPLTSPTFCKELEKITGRENLFFFDAIAPIITVDSIDFNIVFKSSRYQSSHKENDDKDGDYINCPLDKETYFDFVDSLLHADRIPLKDFEVDLNHGVKAGAGKFFEGCLPVEVLAQRGKDALAFGPMRPIGLIDPKTGKRPYAVLQLRQDNLAGTLYNMVGFQTNLTIPDQRRIFRMIPGLENARFERFGQMHRNTFIFSPSQMKPTMQSTNRADLFFAGQITGVEGYAGNIATGLIAGINILRLMEGKELIIFPKETMLGALISYITQATAKDFQPMKANLGILPPLLDINHKTGKREKGKLFADRSIESLKNFIEQNFA